MKTKIKRHSRSVISVLLAVCMLISCMTAAMIATDAAKTQDESVGATTYYYHYGTGSNYWSSNGIAMTNSGTTWYADVSFTTQYNNYVRINTTSNSINTSDTTSVSTSYTNNYSSVVDKISYSNNVDSSYAGYKIELKSAPSSSTTVRISFDTSDMTKIIVSDPSGGSGGSGSGETGTSVTDNNLIAVLKGTKIMIYFGDRWSPGTKYVKNGTSATDNATSGTPETLSIDSENCNVANGYITVNTESDTYSISNQESSWAGMSINDGNDMTTSQGGYLYYMYNDGSDKLVTKSSSAAVSWTTSTDTITEGDSSCSIAAAVSGTTGAGRSVSVKYYYTTNNTNFYTFDPSDTSELTAGTYTIYATAYDTKIHVAASTQATLTVEEPEAKHAVTFNASPSAGGAITPASGTEVGEVTSTNITATPNAAYTFSGWTFGDGITGESTSNASTTITTKSSGDYTVTANFTKKPTHKVTVVSNNNALGTATASVTEAYEGQQVTLIPKEDTGSFSSWSVTSGGVTVSSNKFTMGSSDVAITATFVAYSETSNFYYNSYGSNGQPADTHYGAQMSEAKIGGQTYSYYRVTGRTETDQLFTVSYGTPKYNSYNTYFQFPKTWGGTAEVQFYATDGKNLGNYTNMTADGEENEKLKWKYPIPDGAKEVQFKHGSDYSGKLSFTGGNNAWYVDSNMTDLHGWNSSNPVETNFWENFNGTKYTDAFESKGFDNHNANRGDSHAYTKPKDLGAYSGDYYVLVLYKGKTYTINGVTKTISSDPEIIWLPELPDSADTIKVYAKDGAIAGYGQTYADLADTTVLKADGTTSAGATKYTSTGNQTYEVYKAQRGETITIKTTIGLDKNGNDLTSPTAASLRSKYYVRGFMVNGEVPKGTLITTPDTTNGVYTLTYTVPEDFEGKYIEITPVYYLVNTTTYPVVTFRATDFPKNQHNWGDTLYVYPFYGKLGGYNNAFGVYAGQPMIFYNGQYSIQIPQKSTAWALDSANLHSAASTLAQVNNISVSGVTMSNGYYDTIHKLIMGYGDNSASADHVQTYDYGDFYKIFNEKKPVDNIVFDFKYRTTTHNLETNAPSSLTPTNFASTYQNGFELLKNFHGRNVDIFGNALSGDAADDSKTKPLYVVSIGGVNGSNGVENIAGYYATEWKVYAPDSTTGTPSASDTYQLVSNGKSSIPPEVLVLNDDDTTSFNTTTYPSADSNHTITDWKALYTELKTYAGRPVMISYEAADAQIGSGNYATSGSGGATRNDGRWLYSKNGESITSNIKIQYSNDNGTTYIDLDTANPQVDGLSAYFTNTDVYGTQTYATTIDPDKTFNFEAKTTNGQYKFVGWYLDDSNKTLITSDNAGSTERSGSYTFIAKFMKVTSGQLILSHSVDTGTIGGTNYDGAGTVTIAAVVKDGEGATVKTFAPTTSDITLDNKIIKSDNTAYTVDVTLTATRGNNSALGTTILATPEDQESKFFDYGDFTVSADGKTRTYSFSFSVGDLYSGTTQTYMNLIYHSYFKNYVFKYTVNYEFTGRDGGTKIYNRAGTLTAPQAEAYVYKDTVSSGGSEIEMRFLRKEFFESLAPYESNFRQSLTWNFTNKQFTDGTNYVYNCNAHFEASQNDSNEKVNVTFVLPYAHTNGVATLNNGVGTAETSTNYALINDGENDNRVSFGTIPTLTGGRTNGIYTEVEKSHWIAAPAKLNDGSFFSYWSIKTTDGNVEVARCYFPGFNFLAYDNYVIEAVYGSAASSISASGINTSVTYLSTTRNQWNALNSSQEAVPDVQKGDTTNAADVLFNDFVLSYNYNGADIYLNGSDASDIEELGVVVERVKELDKNSDNSYDTRISSYTSLEENETNVDTAINTQVDQNGKATYKTGSLQYYKQTIGKNQLDNKNRIQFYEAFFNASGWDSIKQKPKTGYTYKKYVYRAYSYMKLSNGNIVKSATPAYFTMYDVATASYSSN